MKRRVAVRLGALLLAALLCIPCISPALADEYDPRYPENLAEGHLTASAAILIEQDTGQVIFEKNADERMYPASTTKILTVWLALMLGEELPEGMETKFPVSANAANLAPDESSAKFAIGEEVRLIDLCNAAILVSGNDAATAIAEGLSGSVDAFVERMNSAAYALGCNDTHFVNANGLHDENHYTTARDMANMSRVAMENEEFRIIVRREEYTLPRDNVYRSRTIRNGNNFVAKPDEEKKQGRYYPYSTGIKTGTTSAAGNCLVASASLNGVNLIAVVFGATSDASRYEDAKKLMEYGFTQIQSTNIEDIYNDNPRTVDIRGFDQHDPQVGRLKLNIRKITTDASDLIITSNEGRERWKQNFYNLTFTEFTRELVAPVTAGEVMGKLTYYSEDGIPIEYELIASRSIAAREDLAPSIEAIIAAAENDPNPFPRITPELVIVYLVLPAAAIYIAIRILKKLLSLVGRRKKVKSYKPNSRYYR